MSFQALQVPRPGVEPGRIAPLVFETSASTNSAIWAYCAAKVALFSELAKIKVKKTQKTCKDSRFSLLSHSEF